MPTEDPAELFERRRHHLRAMARRMLGSAADADDAVQQAWLRVSRSDLGDVENLDGWLTTVTARVCLDMLRARRRRQEHALPARLDLAAGDDPAGEAELASAVGLGMLVVLDRLSPAQRVAFVLHDLFSVPFEEVGAVLDRSPVAAKKLASRARRLVHGAEPPDPARLAEDWQVVEAFLAAARGGDIAGLLAVLAPDVVRRADPALTGGAPPELRGARAVAEGTRSFAHLARAAQVVLVDGEPGIVVAPAGRLAAIIRVIVRDGRIAAYDVTADARELDRAALAVPRPGQGSAA